MPLTTYVFAKSIDRGGPGIAPEWPEADPLLNRFYLKADADAEMEGLQARITALEKAIRKAVNDTECVGGTNIGELKQALAAKGEPTASSPHTDAAPPSA